MSIIRMSLAVLVFCNACAALPEDYDRAPSTAFQGYLDTRFGKLFETAEAQNPGLSGFALIRRGHKAFTARIALATLAEKSLDVQYYIWETDATGRLLAKSIFEAAERGVRVRILIDDINLKGRDLLAASMDAHPSIEVRIFNPFAHRERRAFDFFIDLDRINHRMHNKLIVADNAVAIVGGRNIGNHYFGVATDANFRDLDIAAAGPVVRDASEVFDYFWNGDWAVPIAALAGEDYDEEDLKAEREKVLRRIAQDNYPYPLDRDVAELESELVSIRDQFVWAPGRIIWDDPTAISEGITEGVMIQSLFRKADTLHTELLIESAYFVTQDKSVEAVNKLTDRGVRVRVLTNSLASNDVVAAHAGHAKRRKKLLASGLELYELRPDASVVKQRSADTEAKAALHTKAVVFDGESVFIGSFNLDPRSAKINTEAGLFVESRALAEQLTAYMDEGVKPGNSYRVVLDEEGELEWITEIDGREVRYHKEPESTIGQRLMSNVIQMLPVEHQL